MKSVDELVARVEALEARLEASAASIDPNTLYTVTEACDRLRCKQANLYQLVRSGALASVRTGARGSGIHVQGSDILRFIESRREGGPKQRMAFKHLKVQ